MTPIGHRVRPRVTADGAPDDPPVAGMPAEVWTWLRTSLAVRPAAVADARARLDAGVQPTAAELADAVLLASVTPS